MLHFRYMIFKNARLWCNGICKMRNCGLTVYEKCGIAGYRYIYKVCDCGLIRVLILYHVLQYCLTMKQDKQYRHVTLSLLTFIYSSLHLPKHHLYTSIMFFMVSVNTIKINIILYIRYKCISSRSLYG